jgi:hypothetical protein
MQGVSKRALKWYSICYCLASVTKRLYLKAYKLSIVQHLQRWIVCMPLSLNVFITHSNIWNSAVESFLNTLYYLFYFNYYAGWIGVLGSRSEYMRFDAT